MRKIILLVHTSLDGYVAGSNGELDGFAPGEENLEFVCKLTENADAALFGRNSFELIETNWPGVKDKPGATKAEVLYSTWYNNAQRIVVSTTLQKKGSEQIIRKNIPEEIIKLKKQPGKEILIFGSPTLSRLLMQHALIDSYWIFINPAVFGRGIPLFTESPDAFKFNLQSIHRFTNGEVAMNYIPLQY